MAVQVVSGTAQMGFSFGETATIAFNTSGTFPAALPPSGTSPVFQFNNATAGAGNVDTWHAKQYSLASTTAAIDLNGGSLLSPSGAACVFARVRLFVVSVVTATAGSLIKIYGSASNAPLWLPLVATFAWANSNGGDYVLYDPNSITTAGYLVDGTHKSVTFDSGSNTVVFNVLIVGNSSQS